MRMAVTALAMLAGLAGCAHVADAPLPSIPVAGAYQRGAGGPATALEPDRWWARYQDEDLDRLQHQLLDNSPGLGRALARWRQASAATQALRAARSPTVAFSADASRARQSDNRPLRGATSPEYYNDASLGLRLDYELDLWGRIDRQVAAGQALETASQADLAAARLALQVQLTDTLLALRGTDREIALLRDTHAAYARAADMVAERQRGGIASGLDLARAQVQRDATASQLQQAQAQRALLAHAIAALVGESASSFSLPPKAVPDVVPAIPVGLPSELLARRPDIVAAQQRVVAANASVGVARTAYFPSVRLSAAGGLQSDDIGHLIAAPNLFWALGPGLAMQLFDGGRRQAEIARTEAVLDEAGHGYRGVVLGAFQQVEDLLALLDHYGQAAVEEERAVVLAQRASDLADNRYRSGAASYLDVVSAQTAALQAQRSALDLNTRQRRASVQLVRALGGGWPGIPSLTISRK